MSFLNIDRFRIILASNSPRRKKFLEKINIPFEIITHEIEEIYPSNFIESEISDHIAMIKAAPFKGKLKKNELVITADTIVWIENKCLGKPKTKNESKEMLKKISNKDHKVITSVCLTSIDKQIIFNEKSLVSFRKLKTNEINYYVDNFYTLDKAGAYGIQDWIGIIGIKKIIGSYTNIVGLPVSQLIENIKAFIKYQ